MGRRMGRLGEPWTQSEEGGGVQQGQWQRLDLNKESSGRPEGSPVPGSQPWSASMLCPGQAGEAPGRCVLQVTARMDLRAAGAVAQRCGDHTLTQHKDNSWSSDENTGVLTGLLLPERPNAFIQLTVRVRFVLTILPLCLQEVIRRSMKTGTCC